MFPDAVLIRKGTVYTFQRYSKPVLVNGQLQQPTPILNSGNPWQMTAVIQPLSGFQVLTLPEAFRNKVGCTVYTNVLLQVADEQANVLGDRFQWNGYLYEVMFRQDWSLNPHLSHYRFTAFKPAKA